MADVFYYNISGFGGVSIVRYIQFKDDIVNCGVLTICHNECPPVLEFSYGIWWCFSFLGFYFIFYDSKIDINLNK